jgi:hypothetical protein
MQDDHTNRPTSESPNEPAGIPATPPSDVPGDDRVADDILDQLAGGMDTYPFHDNSGIDPPKPPTIS